MLNSITHPPKNCFNISTGTSLSLFWLTNPGRDDAWVQSKVNKINSCHTDNDLMSFPVIAVITMIRLSFLFSFNGKTANIKCVKKSSKLPLSIILNFLSLAVNANSAVTFCLTHYIIPQSGGKYPSLLPTLIGLCNKWKTKIIISLQLSGDEKYCTWPITFKLNLWKNFTIISTYNMLLILAYTVYVHNIIALFWHKPILGTPCNHLTEKLHEQLLLELLQWLSYYNQNGI